MISIEAFKEAAFIQFSNDARINDVNKNALMRVIAGRAMKHPET
jgi:hypothetical protein